MNRPHDVEDTEQHLGGFDSKVQGQIMYFFVNAFSPNLLDVAISNFAVAKFILFGGHCTTFCVTLTHRSRSSSVLFVNASSP